MKKIYVLGILTLFLLPVIIYSLNSNIGVIRVETNSLRTSGYVELDNVITIDNNWSETVAMYSWCSGAGTEEEPYVIEGISINSGTRGACIYIIDSAEYFIIRNCNLSNSIKLYSSDKFAGIYIEKAEFGIIENNTFYKDYIGVSIYEAENVIIRYNEFIGSHNINETGYGRGVLVNEGKEMTITNNTFINYYEGVVIFDSEDCYVDYNYIENYLFEYVAEAGVSFINVNGGSITYNDFYGVISKTQNSTGLSTAGIGSNPILLENCFNIAVYGNRFYDMNGNLIGSTDNPFFNIIIFVVLIGIGAIGFCIILYKYKKNLEKKRTI
ncbi:MAG: NosD domain-containing protein [Candidatus Odinarchaeota archaeon]